MASKTDHISRGNKLAKKYSQTELKSALKSALAIDDNEERLALQWALKQKTNTEDGYAFTREQESNLAHKLAV